MNRLIIVLSLIASCVSTEAADPLKKFRRNLAKKDFSTFEPFRYGSDYNGEIFKVGWKLFGKPTAEIVSPAEQTFATGVDAYITGPLEFAMGDLKDGFSAEGTLQLDGLTTGINAKLVAKYSDELSVSWGGPVQRYLIAEKEIFKFKGNYKSDVQRILDWYEKRNGLNQLQIVNEVLVAPAMTYKFTAKSNYALELKAEKIKQLIDAGFEGKFETTTDYTLTAKEPIAFARRSWKFSEELMKLTVNYADLSEEEREALLRKITVGEQEILDTYLLSE